MLGAIDLKDPRIAVITGVVLGHVGTLLPNSVGQIVAAISFSYIPRLITIGRRTVYVQAIHRIPLGTGNGSVEIAAGVLGDHLDTGLPERRLTLCRFATLVVRGRDPRIVVFTPVRYIGSAAA